MREGEPNSVQADYCFLGRRGEGRDTITVLTAVVLKGGDIMTALARQKGAGDACVLGAVREFLDELPYKKFFFQVDLEAATKEQQTSVCANKEGATPRDSPTER